MRDDDFARDVSSRGALRVALALGKPIAIRRQQQFPNPADEDQVAMEARSKEERSTRWRSRSPWRRVRIAAIAAILLMTGDSSAGATPVGAGPGPGATTAVVFDEQGYGVWFVADLSDPVTPAPIAISPSETAGSWTLDLGFAPGAPDLQIGDQFLLQELVKVEAGDFAVGRWAQAILSPDWRWIDAAIFDDQTSFPLAGLDVQVTDLLVTLSFDPLLAGQDVFVVKTLEYVGSGVSSAYAGLEVATSVYVPEPGVATLLAVGLSIAASTRFGGNVRHD